MKRFEDKNVTLTKIANKVKNHPNGVFEGHSVSGQMTIHKVANADSVRILVGSLLTSPVVEVKDETENSLIFETVGGVYKMELIN